MPCVLSYNPSFLLATCCQYIHLTIQKVLYCCGHYEHEIPLQERKCWRKTNKSVPVNVSLVCSASAFLQLDTYSLLFLHNAERKAELGGVELHANYELSQSVAELSLAFAVRKK